MEVPHLIMIPAAAVHRVRGLAALHHFYWDRMDFVALNCLLLRQTVVLWQLDSHSEGHENELLIE